ncbi:MAG: hypothetical protein H0W15_11880 [Gemmatimonadales bacterium]|nr:hypothetical protein [Gemmatimonadales bacterium]
MPRRLFILLFAVLCGVPTMASAQSLRLEVKTHPDRRTPLIRLYNLFDEDRWRDALVDKSYPIRLHWRLQLWRSRAGFDTPGPVNEWDVVIRREPLLEQYRFTETVGGRRVMDTAFSSVEELRFHYERQQEVAGVAPTRDGEWYYAIRLEVTTLTFEDFDRLERLPGGAAPASGIGAQIARLLVTLSLPSAKLTQESPVFRVRRRN